MIGRLKLTIACCAALLFAGCATTTFTSSWKAPDAQPLTFKAGDKVIALVVSKSPSMRRSGEANLADELDKRGLQGVPSYTLIQESDVTDEGKAKQVIDASGAVGVIAIRPMGSEQEVSSYSTGGYYGSPYYGGFWGGYYGYGWSGAYGGTEIRTDTYVNVETLVYDLRQNKLVWAGKTRTMNPSDVEGFVAELAKAISQELRNSGLVAGK